MNVITAKHETQPETSLPVNELEREVARLHDLHSQELLSYALSITPDEGLARDSVQEAFLRYFVERRLGRCMERPRAWLYGVLRNYLFQATARTTQQAEVRREDIGELRDESSDPEGMLSRAQFAKEIAGLLSARELECLRLRADGLSYSEIAEVLDIRPGTVSALLTRVHIKLRDRSAGIAARKAGIVEALHYLFQGGKDPFIPESIV